LVCVAILGPVDVIIVGQVNPKTGSTLCPY
jgi:hypothetical protein